MESFSFNTAVAAVMELRNAILAAQKDVDVSHKAWTEAIESLLLLLAPITPHLAEELWERRGKDSSIHLEPWPKWDAEMVKEESITLVVQINGKVRDRIEVPAGMDDDSLKSTALSSTKIQGWLEGKSPKKIILVRGRLVSIVV
jgi:leucyl-tRNA synthetase